MQMNTFAISVMAPTLALPTLAESQQNQNQNQNQGRQAQNQQSGQESVLESAPTVGENEMNQVASTDWGQQVDQFWNQHISSGGQQSGGAKSSQ